MLIIDASNLHVGGGVQVAASFISEVPAAFRPITMVFASSEVLENIDLDVVERREFAGFRRLDVSGFFQKGRGEIDRCVKEGDCLFTVFGPVYRWRMKCFSMVGFAQPWIIYPLNECYKSYSLQERVAIRLKYWLQAIYYRRADLLVVELDHVKAGLVRELGIPEGKIRVVKNCVSSAFLKGKVEPPFYISDDKSDLKLGFLGRNYSHKNTAIFPAVAEELNTRYGITVKFYVTFTPEEWEACTPRFRAVCVNVGSISISECPRFYQSIDGVVFPSLLECFSVTPLEAMVMKKPLFVSDRPFNRDVCGPHAEYFDPLSPSGLAQAIAKAYLSSWKNPEKLEAARSYALAFPSAKSRAEEYIRVMHSCVANNSK